MSTFQVFVEGIRDNTSPAVKQLAASMAEHYGLPAGELEMRLRQGRFRVKANLEQSAAEKYARDLENMGAICSIVDAAGQVVARAKSATRQPPRSTRPPSAATAPAANSFSESEVTDLGAIASGSFMLSALDGSADEAPSSGSFGPPVSAFAPPGASDMFAPPDSLEPKELELDTKPAATPAKKSPAAASSPGFPQPASGGTPPPQFGPASSSPDLVFRPPPAPMPVPVRAPPAPQAAGPGMPPPSQFAPPPADRTYSPPVESQGTAVGAGSSRGMGAAVRDLLGQERMRFAAGVGLTVLVGFVPAHLYASMKEKSEFAVVDSKVRSFQAQADTISAWNDLDGRRQEELARKQDAQTDIALTAMMLWAVFAGGIGYLWFRHIDWDRWLDG